MFVALYIFKIINIIYFTCSHITLLMLFFFFTMTIFLCGKQFHWKGYQNSKKRSPISFSQRPYSSFPNCFSSSFLAKESTRITCCSICHVFPVSFDLECSSFFPWRSIMTSITLAFFNKLHASHFCRLSFNLAFLWYRLRIKPSLCICD